MNKPMIVGVAGGTGSGKTTLAEHIAAAFGDNVTVIAEGDLNVIRLLIGLGEILRLH
jgi:uridine kinase